VPPKYPSYEGNPVLTKSTHSKFCNWFVSKSFHDKTPLLYFARTKIKFIVCIVRFHHMPWHSNDYDHHLWTPLTISVVWMKNNRFVTALTLVNCNQRGDKQPTAYNFKTNPFRCEYSKKY
jgi:hypothetical protein